MDLYKKATRKKLRFPSIRGMLSVEDLWDLPLIAPGDFSLDGVAKAINRQLKTSEEESFVEPKKEEENLLEIQLDLVKDIIQYKIDMATAAEKREATKAKKAKILAALERKEDADLEEQDAESLKKMLDEL